MHKGKIEPKHFANPAIKAEALKNMNARIQTLNTRLANILKQNDHEARLGEKRTFLGQAKNLLNNEVLTNLDTFSKTSDPTVACDLFNTINENFRAIGYCLGVVELRLKAQSANTPFAIEVATTAENKTAATSPRGTSEENPMLTSINNTIKDWEKKFAEIGERLRGDSRSQEISNALREIERLLDQADAKRDDFRKNPVFQNLVDINTEIREKIVPLLRSLETPSAAAVTSPSVTSPQPRQSPLMFSSPALAVPVAVTNTTDATAPDTPKGKKKKKRKLPS